MSEKSDQQAPSSPNDAADKPKPIRLDFAAIGRILDAVAEAGLPVPPAYQAPSAVSGVPNEQLKVAREKRAELSSNISWAYTFRNLHTDLTKDNRPKERFELLGKIVRQARALRMLLGERSELKRISRHVPIPGVGIDSAIEMLEQLERAADTERKAMRRFYKKGWAAPFGDVEIDPWTANTAYYRALGDAFERVYSHPAKIQQNSMREPKGPFLAFIFAIRREMGDREIDAGSIRKAVARAALQDKAH